MKLIRTAGFLIAGTVLALLWLAGAAVNSKDKNND